MKQMVFKLRQKFLDRLINYYGPYVGAGVKLVHMSKDFREARVEMPLTVYNKNYMGTQFGGSLYSMTDPWYMLMLIKNLGPDYIVWDKAAKIRFRKPGKGTLFAEFNLSGAEIAEIKRLAETERSIDRVYDLELKDKAGVVHAEIEKTIYIRKKGNE